MAVTPLFAQWLQSAADYVVRTDAGATGWGATALTTERLTGIATRVGAAAEADRQLAFLSRGPFAIEAHELVGTDWSDAIGTVVTMISDDLGYAAGIDVFALEVDVDRGTGISVVTVLRPLGTTS